VIRRWIPHHISLDVCYFHGLLSLLLSVFASLYPEYRTCDSAPIIHPAKAYVFLPNGLNSICVESLGGKKEVCGAVLI